MSAPDDSYRTAPTSELIDDLLDNRPEVYQKAKEELLARLTNTKNELVAMEAEHSKPANK
jgi:hypothetical protein